MSEPPLGSYSIGTFVNNALLLRSVFRKAGVVSEKQVKLVFLSSPALLKIVLLTHRMSNTARSVARLRLALGRFTQWVLKHELAMESLCR